MEDKASKLIQFACNINSSIYTFLINTLLHSTPQLLHDGGLFLTICNIVMTSSAEFFSRHRCPYKYIKVVHERMSSSRGEEYLKMQKKSDSG